MVVDIGGGTTEVAVISLGGIVVSRSLRVGGYEMDDAIVRYVRDHHRLLIGQERAEEAKIAVGSATEVAGLPDTQASGRDLVSGGLRRIRLRPEEVREALQRPVSQILDTVKQTLEATPPELAADIANGGIVLVGGGSLLRGLPELMRAETQLPVDLAESPLTCVAIGAGQSLQEVPFVRQIASSHTTAVRRRRRGR
jgi:rod shape-determining protein MreB